MGWFTGKTNGKHREEDLNAKKDEQVDQDGHLGSVHPNEFVRDANTNDILPTTSLSGEEFASLIDVQAVKRKLKEGASKTLSEAKDILVFDAGRQILYTNIQNLDEAELPAIATAFGNRNDAIRRGVQLQGKRFEIHRYHPPYIYGRSKTDPSDSVGFALCKTTAADGVMTVFALITYDMPALSARMVPQLEHFCTEYIKSIKQY